MGLTVGVDVGGTKVAAGVVDDDGVILAQLREPTPKTDTSAIAEVIAGMVDQLRADHPVEAVGVGAAGFIDATRTTVLFAPNLAWRDEPLADRVTKLIDLPVVVENDGNCHAWAEWRFGAARGARAAVAVVVGTGIGGGWSSTGGCIAAASALPASLAMCGSSPTVCRAVADAAGALSSTRAATPSSGARASGPPTSRRMPPASSTPSTAM